MEHHALCPTLKQGSFKLQIKSANQQLWRDLSAGKKRGSSSSLFIIKDGMKNNKVGKNNG
ncbi:hypothetical protein KVG29_07815 [Caldicoprobacter algeriensis]|uniref:hypothetical protein n=1 Tax=Caldicoprobacter algeriensis TaxID=699281 RepID=UPI0020799AE6|nr:hypothetical protein [Caldicoprobacter algeriensis]MCM8901133.1 hypothetical protein [Caldicoprobacter algeriensis]